jgi:hypothetical protein
MARRPRTPILVRSKEGQAARGSDYPQVVKAACAVARRGGTLPPSQCVVCHKRSRTLRREVCVPEQLLRVMGDTTARPVLSLICESCYTAVPLTTVAALRSAKQRTD